MTSELRTFLTFQRGEATAALDHYAEIVRDFEMTEIERYGADGPGPEGTVMAASFRLAGNSFGCSDSPIEHAWGFIPAVSLWIDCDDDYGFSTRFGWVGDRHGVTWQLNLP